jgi:hypothetical protein
MKRILAFAVSILGSVAVWAAPPPVFPIPIRGGDQIPPPINAFAPGPPALAFDGLNAEPFVITNISGVTAMGYTLGQATDSAGTAYQVFTDLRVFKGDYVGAQLSSAGTPGSATAHGTFVLI